MHRLPRQLEPRRQIRQANGLRLVADGFQHSQHFLQSRQPLIAFHLQQYQ
jgi:hypothetical protein